MASEYYSTLPEVDGRAEAVTLEARVSYPGLEPSPRKWTPSRPSLPSRHVPWWKRYWILLAAVVVVVATAAIVGGTVFGVMLKSRSTTSGNGNSSADNGGSKSGSASIIIVSSAYTNIGGSFNVRHDDTAIYRPDYSTHATRRHDGNNNNLHHQYTKYTISYHTGSINSYLHSDSRTPNTKDVAGLNPCSIPCLQWDGLEYVINGCGGDLWITWRDPGVSTQTEFELYSNDCPYVPQNWKCGTTTIHGDWRCGHRI
ncbi:hypothetical protein B0H66DRAFT_602439 [Apodospora peruviana]|uniref:Uncharacterized protein n=1 Tax=Apodospora peruviana TaxID=516989 RepID=A0AAE0IDM0_9PEZI|nr:hypothetical protein B0H66DRAFT_602439 [Apodospora peruviana]